MTELEGIPLKRQRSEVAEIDIKKCIICQIDTNESTCSNAQARMKILKAARIRNVFVARRLEQVDHELFIYHINNKRYKSYTLKKTKFEEEESKATEESEGDESVPCIHNYLIRYDQAKSKCDARSNSTAKNRCFAKLMENIDSPLKSGQGFALSDLRDNVNDFSVSKETFSNRDIRFDFCLKVTMAKT